MSSLIRRSTPVNLLEEKEKFFADKSYNPQLIYEEFIDQDELIKYGLPQKKYLDLANEILKKTYFGRNENDLNMLEGKQLSQEEVTTKVTDFLAMHELQDTIDIVWSHTFISRTTINEDSIKLRLPADYRREGLLGMLYHEVGTHALRRVNYKQQPWYRKKKKFGFSSYLKTEEGLASLHTVFPKSFKSAYTQALRYLIVDKASQASFAELWNFVGSFIQDEDRRWVTCVRAKRGISDTSLPGGFSKDLVYFEGMVDVWHWLRLNSYSLDKIYYGKLAMEDVDKAVELNPHFIPVLPSFYTLQTEIYQQTIESIGQENGFSQI